MCRGDALIKFPCKLRLQFFLLCHEGAGATTARPGYAYDSKISPHWQWYSYKFVNVHSMFAFLAEADIYLAK